MRVPVVAVPSRHRPTEAERAQAAFSPAPAFTIAAEHRGKERDRPEASRQPSEASAHQPSCVVHVTLPSRVSLTSDRSFGPAFPPSGPFLRRVVLPLLPYMRKRGQMPRGKNFRLSKGGTMTFKFPMTARWWTS